MNENLEPGVCSEKLGALAAPERLRIVQLLRSRPHNVGEVAAELGIPLVNASHHLNVLLKARLVCNRKQGRYVVYSLPPGAIQGGENGEAEHLDLGCCRLEMPRPE